MNSTNVKIVYRWHGFWDTYVGIIGNEEADLKAKKNNRYFRLRSMSPHI